MSTINVSFVRNACFREDLTRGVADETLSPEFDAVAAHRRLVPHPVDGCDITAVGNGVAPLNRLPAGVLAVPMFVFLTRDASRWP